MDALNNRLKNTPVVYITRDIERALAMDLSTPGFFIISNYTAFAKQLSKTQKNISLIKEKNFLDTWQLLEHPQTKKILQSLNKAQIMVFKNTKQIENICQQNNWPLLNPSAKLANLIEEKISQVDYLKELKKYFPDYQINKCAKIKWPGHSFILQFNRSHTGSGTLLIKNEKQLTEIKKKFPLRLARTAKYIVGPLFTNNNIVWGNKILLGNISYQITGLEPFTDKIFATIGNDWSLPRKILSIKQIKKYQTMARAVGNKLKKQGWQGIFGIDVVLEKKTGKLYLLEVNARQPASTSFESNLQQKERKKNEISCFEAHLSSLLKIKQTATTSLVKIDKGAQIIQRVTKKTTGVSKLKQDKLKKEKLSIWLYDNHKLGSDLLRIQTKQALMLKHDKFNGLGKKILKIIK